MPAATTAGAADEEPVHIRLAMLNYISFAPLFIAVEEGYFAEQGLDVELVSFTAANSDSITMLVQGQLDVGTGPLSAQALNAIAQGANLKFVADKGFANPEAPCVTDAWVAGNSLRGTGTAERAAALRGTKVVSSLGTAFEYGFDELLARGGLTLDDVELVEVRDNPARLEALRSGSVDVGFLAEPWVTRAVNTGAAQVWVGYPEILPEFPVSMLIYGPNLLEDRPEVGVRFMAAYLKAVRQFNAQGKSDRNIEIISKYTQMSPEELRSICWTSIRDDGLVSEEAFEQIIDWTVEKGYADVALPLNKVWDPTFLEAAQALLSK